MAAPPTMLRCQKGSSVIEMALAAPVLALLLIGMVDLSRGYSTKLQLEQAAQRTVERVQNIEYNLSQNAALKTEAATTAGVPETAVTVSNWLECNNDGVHLAFTGSCSDPDHPYARYVEIQIQKSYSPMFSSRFAGANADGTYTIVGTAGVRVQ